MESTRQEDSESEDDRVRGRDREDRNQKAIITYALDFAKNREN